MRCTLGKSLMWSQGIGLAMVAILLSACGPGQAQSDLNNPERWESRDEFLSSRKELRAYDGAPPVIPHSVTDLGRNNCAGCHIGEHAPAVLRAGHGMRPNCSQCHVPAGAGGVSR